MKRQVLELRRGRTLLRRCRRPAPREMSKLAPADFKAWMTLNLIPGHEGGAIRRARARSCRRRRPCHRLPVLHRVARHESESPWRYQTRDRGSRADLGGPLRWRRRCARRLGDEVLRRGIKQKKADRGREEDDERFRIRYEHHAAPVEHTGAARDFFRDQSPAEMARFRGRAGAHAGTARTYPRWRSR